MNGKLTCQQRPKYPKYISSVNYFTLIPEEIILLIISILGSLNCRQLSMTSQLLRNFFTYYIVPCISNKTKIDFQLADSYAKDGSPFSLKPTYIPQFLILKNSYQLMKYKKTMDPLHDDCLIIDLSKDLPLFDLFSLSRISGFSSIFINWSNYPSTEYAIKHSLGEFKKIFQFKEYPYVKKFVFNNLVYSSGFIHSLHGTFNELKSLKIASFNTKSRFDTNLENFTTINELEITLPTSDDFGDMTTFTLPFQLKKITFNSLQHNSEPVPCTHKCLTIQTLPGTLLDTIIINNNLYGNDDLDVLLIDIPPSVQNLILNTNEWKSIFCLPKSDYSHLKKIHVSQDIVRHVNQDFVDVNHFGKYTVLPFLILSPDGKLRLDYGMCPNCKEFGVFDKYGKLHIIWKMQ